ncbi:hypothetical protein ACIRU3_27755 [Streptomyces sp. NPDC101151]|uniref:hypothetical protein n=1 Tax=Streptomyces sp. NPDC101151 TaxID=3366115 RepID=UPI0037F387A6
MWPGEQPPGSGQQHNPYQQPGNGQPNPYQQPAGPQHHPYAGPQHHPHAGQQPPAPWAQPTVTTPPPQPGGGRTRLVAILAAAAVVVASGVTGFLLLGGKKDDGARPGPTASSPTAASPSASSAADDPRSADGEKPTVAGWKVVVNPVTGIAFDVPAAWQVRSKSWITYVTEQSDDDKVLVGMKAPAVLKEKWCAADEDRDGKTDYTSLANVGTRGNKDAKNTAQIAREDSANWVYGWYTQPDRKKVRTGPVTSYTTASGITGSVATSRSTGVVKQDRCDSEGKATTFAFKDSDGALLSWSLFSAAGVSEEVPDATIRKIMSTVRLYAEPSHS